MNTKSVQRPKRSGWVIFGSILTVAYVCGVAFVLLSDSAESVLHLKQTDFTLNTFGDFLAGVCAPLAFLWLFVATMVQSQELALQRDELILTRLEFQQSRDVARQQAEEARSQAAFIGAQTRILQSAEIDKLIDVKMAGIRQWIEDASNLPSAIELKDPSTGRNAEVEFIFLDRSKTVRDIAFDLMEAANTAAHFREAGWLPVADKLVDFSQLVERIVSVAEDIPKASEKMQAQLKNDDFDTLQRAALSLLRSMKIS